MTEITLPADIAAALAASSVPVRLVAPDGRVVAVASPAIGVRTPAELLFTPEEIAAAEKEADQPGPRYTTAQVLEHLRSLSDK